MNLKIDQSKYRTFVEESFAAEKDPEVRKDKWRYYELKGKYGIIYPYSEECLCVTWIPSLDKKSNGRKMLKKRPQWELVQEGDWEHTFRIPNKDLEVAAELIQANKKRVYSEEALIRLKEHAKSLSKAKSNSKNPPLTA